MTQATGYREGELGTAAAPFVSKSIELEAESARGWEDAVRYCVVEASRTLQNITGIQVDRVSASVREAAIVSYRVRCRVTFRIDDRLRSH